MWVVAQVSRKNLESITAIRFPDVRLPSAYSVPTRAISKYNVIGEAKLRNRWSDTIDLRCSTLLSLGLAIVEDIPKPSLTDPPYDLIVEVQAKFLIYLKGESLRIFCDSLFWLQGISSCLANGCKVVIRQCLNSESQGLDHQLTYVEACRLADSSQTRENRSARRLYWLWGCHWRNMNQMTMLE